MFKNVPMNLSDLKIILIGNGRVVPNYLLKRGDKVSPHFHYSSGRKQLFAEENYTVHKKDIDEIHSGKLGLETEKKLNLKIGVANGAHY
jgi:hypothetical protein